MFYKANIRCTMGLKYIMKYIYICVGVLFIYVIVMLNILTEIGGKYKLPYRPGLVQGSIRMLNGKNLISYTESIYNKNGQVTTEMHDLKPIEDQNRLIFENSMNRKRKILAEIMQEHSNDKMTSTETTRFITIGNISIFSAFYDDRENLKLDSPMIRLMAIARRDSADSLVCRYTNNGIDSWILAEKHEMCEHHDKVYGGFMFLCKSPKDVDVIPKKIYIKSLNDLEEKTSTNGKDVPFFPLVDVFTSKPIGLDIISIKHRKVDKMMSQDDRMFDDDYTLDLVSLEDRQYEDTENNLATRKLLNTNETSPRSADRNGKNTNVNDEHKVASDNSFIIPVNEKENKPKRSELAACIPPLFGNIPLSKLIQFMEYLRLQSVDKVYMYVMDVSREVRSVLQYYQDQGFLISIKWDLPQQINKYIWYNGQIIAIQDCLYRTMGHFDYVAFLDMDEIIIPKTAPDWSSMLQKFENDFISEEFSDLGGFRFKSAFFDPEITDSIDPEISDSKINYANAYKLSFLKSVYRTRSYSHKRTKLIVRPEYVVEMGIHHVSKPLLPFYNVTFKDVSVATASIHHYRPCTIEIDSHVICTDIVTDTSILKYADVLNIRYEIAAKQIVNIIKSL